MQGSSWTNDRAQNLTFITSHANKFLSIKDICIKKNLSIQVSRNNPLKQAQQVLISDLFATAYSVRTSHLTR